MPLFKYRAKKSPTENIENFIEASSKEEALEHLSRNNLFPLKIEEYIPAKGEQPSPSRRVFATIRGREVTLFSRELSSLLKAGVPMLTALSILKEQTVNPKLKEVLSNIHNEVKNGTDLSRVLAQFKKVFSPLYIAMVRAGEESGTLPEILLRIAQYRRRQEEIVSHVRAALAYPILMTVVGIGTVIFMLTFVMPRLVRIFSDLDQTLPLPTVIVMAITNYLRQGWMWILLVFILFLMLLRSQLKTVKGKKFLSLLQLKMPLFGSFLLKVELARLSRTLELLIKSGIPVLRAIEVTVPVLQNEKIKEELQMSAGQLQEGGSFGRTLKKSKLFPQFMTNLLIVGEESGKIDDSLGEVATSYEMDIEESIKTITSLLEPIVILVMGLIVGFFVISMLLPLFQITTTIQ